MRKSLVTCALLSLLTACSQVPRSSQSTANHLAETLSLNYQVVTTNGEHQDPSCQRLGAEWGNCHIIKLNLHACDTIDPTTDWSLYFHSVRRVLAVNNPDFRVTRITGDLHKLEPTKSFTGFSRGATISIPLVAEFWSLFESDFMPRAYIITGDSEPKLLSATDTEDLSALVSPIAANAQLRTPDDNNIIATAHSRFDKNSDISLLSTSQLRGQILPTPLAQTLGSEDVMLTAGMHFTHQGLSPAMLEAISQQARTLGIEQGKLAVNIRLDSASFEAKLQQPGAYQLKVTPAGVEVIGFDAIGAFYGVQSFFNAIEFNPITLKPMQIASMQVMDAPRYQYRGLMVDVARNFRSQAAILRTLEQMAAVKLNKLHLHLSDDEGWRLAITDLPELTTIGAKRCHDLSERTCLLPQLGSGPATNNQGSGFYSRDEYIEIVRFAAARGIEVIPEFDMPGHSRAAVVSMEARYQRLIAQGNTQAANEYRLIDPLDTSNVMTVQFYDKTSFINPCLASSTRFASKIISEVNAMHLEAGAPLTTWHFGGDEAKNIQLGQGFQDPNAAAPEAWRGTIDLSAQDKPFAKSPVCQQLIASGAVTDAAHLPSYFAKQVSAIASNQGIGHFQAWQDGLKYAKDAAAFDSDIIRVNIWETLYSDGAKAAYEWANKGYQVVISNPDYVYVDMPYEVDPKERGYYWATRATDERKMFGFAPANLPQNAETSVDRDGHSFNAQGVTNAPPFHGLSVQLWSETVRTDEQYEYMVFPRLLAAAERAWHQASWELPYQVGIEFNQATTRVDDEAQLSDWSRFANMLGQRQLLTLDKHQVQYRVPVPGAKIIEGKLNINLSLPGLPLQYSLNNSDWLDYSAKAPPEINGKVWVRALSADGKRIGRAISVPSISQ